MGARAGYRGELRVEGGDLGSSMVLMNAGGIAGGIFLLHTLLLLHSFCALYSGRQQQQRQHSTKGADDELAQYTSSTLAATVSYRSAYSISW